MGQNGSTIEVKYVKDITGSFIVPDYQRGYRWDVEVKTLLNDLYAITDKPYCLQPIVVKRRGDEYELIDGQQRLTTLYLIYAYMHAKHGGIFKKARFSIRYETREKSAEFLVNIDLERKEENIDFWFLSNAYQIIEKWFEEQDSVSAYSEIASHFEKRVQVIWYEVGDEEKDPIALFARLNIGKIALTSAELVKAMFLCETNTQKISDEKKDEIAFQWDNIERELHDETLWYFLTNDKGDQYQTRIDLVLNLIAGNDGKTREKYATFFYFDNLRKDGADLLKVWRSILHTFLILKGWRENHELYHKIGYLIASGSKTILDVFEMSKSKEISTKEQFRDTLNDWIRDSIRIKGNYADLSYESSTGYEVISRLLQLFNVESVRKNGEKTQWFPFDKFKYGKKGKSEWTLEHIHAQQAKGLQGQKIWLQWLEKHLPSVRVVDHPDELIEKMEKVIASQTITGTEFEQLQREVIGCLSDKSGRNYMHSISNLALLKLEDNTKLSNTAFDVKRKEIIEMDMEGKYIPFCTKMVFLKYYTLSEGNQLHFWSQEDRDAYIAKMNDVLKDYLDGKEIRNLTMPEAED